MIDKRIKFDGKVDSEESYLSQLKPIELEIWSEPDEHHKVKVVGMKKFRDVYTEIKEQLEKANLTNNLDYMICDWEDKIPLNYSIKAFVTWGSCEGIYVDVKIKFKLGNEIVEKSLITAKTLGQKPEDYAAMGKLATAIAYLLNC